MFRFFTACFFVAAKTAAAAPLLASVPYVADLVRELSCEGAPIPIEVIVKSDRDPHAFTLLPADRARIARAPLVLFVHPAFETWLVRAPSAPAGNAFALAEGLPLRRVGAQGADSLGAVDPHIWQSTSLTLRAAERLSERLSALQPARASGLRKCFAAFREKVGQAERELRKAVASLPQAQRVLATNHDAFSAFAEAFGLEVVAVQGFSTEGSPSPAQLKLTIEAVRKRGIKAVFLEASVPDRIMRSVSRETGVKIGGTLYADGLGPPGSGAETTLALWRKNMDTIVAALR